MFAFRSLVAGKTVKVEEIGKDQYKRVLGVVYVGRVNVNEKMIKAGYAWRYKYSKDSRYLKLQNEAKRKKKGLWAGKNPIDPWQWRKERKKVLAEKALPTMPEIPGILPILRPTDNDGYRYKYNITGLVLYFQFLTEIQNTIYKIYYIHM